MKIKFCVKLFLECYLHIYTFLDITLVIFKNYKMMLTLFRIMNFLQIWYNMNDGIKNQPQNIVIINSIARI